ncbi:MAG TPA: hypothetical protein VFK02_25915 [Kofleriaceae bacterium]|nr:hypothetical protein [Kofleriaceae bacterium]
MTAGDRPPDVLERAHALAAELTRAFEASPFDDFATALRRRLAQLSAGMLDGQVIARPQAQVLAAHLIERVGELLERLVERPGEALRVLDALRSTGFLELEPERDRFERECARRFPPPAPVTWRELAELRALATAHPAHCQLGPPVIHVEFAARLEAAGTPLPGELLGFYAAASHVALSCRHVAAAAGRICPGDALRVRDGRLILFDRIKRHPTMLLIEQPGISIAQALGTWWLVLEDDRAPEIRRPLDLQGLLRFALRRGEAPSLEVLLTDLAWRRFFV